MTQTDRRGAAPASSPQRLADHAAEQRDAYAALAADELGRATPDTSVVDRLLADSERWGARAESYATRAAVIAEPLTYRQGGEHSYFADLVYQAGGASFTNRQSVAAGAAQRLERHRQELDVELAARDLRARAASPDGTRFEKRVNPNRTPGQGGNAAPPLWLIDHVATQARPGRVLGDLIPSFPLPSGVGSISVPQITTGMQVTPPVDTAASGGGDYADAGSTSPVVPVVSTLDVPLQMLEQSPRGSLDQIIWKDALSAYDADLEALLLNGGGVGTNGQLAGLLSIVPTGNVVTYTDATPTAAKLLPFAGQLAAKVGNARLLPPQIYMSRTSRWAWIATGEDAQGQPLSSPGHLPPPPTPYVLDDDRPTPTGSLAGFPLFPNDAIPATLGAGGNQDAIIATRPSDMLLWEGAPRLAVHTESLSGNLNVRIRLMTNVAALVGRYPSATAVLQGTGTIVQAGWN